MLTFEEGRAQCEVYTKKIRTFYVLIVDGFEEVGGD